MIELPDDLLRQAEARAVREGRNLEDIVTEGLRRVLGVQLPPAEATPRRPVSFPLVPETARGAAITTEQVNQALADEEAERYAPFVRR